MGSELMDWRYMYLEIPESNTLVPAPPGTQHVTFYKLPFLASTYGDATVREHVDTIRWMCERHLWSENHRDSRHISITTLHYDRYAEFDPILYSGLIGIVMSTRDLYDRMCIPISKTEATIDILRKSAESLHH